MAVRCVEILDHIPFKVDTSVLLTRLHVREGSRDAKDMHDLLETARPLLRPKAIYKVSYVEGRGSDGVYVEGVLFMSRVLRANLGKVQRVFPYIATCGTELDELDIPSDDFTRRYWIDAIKDMALRTSLEYLQSYLRRKYALEKTSTMSPGAADIDIWPIEQQKQLFSLFPNAKSLIGVTLTDSFLMIPNKSVSGILFPTEVSFKSCQVCQRKNCPSRAAPFDSDLMKSYGHTVEE